MLDLPDEQQFAVLGQWPEAVVNDEFELVYLVANLVEHRGDGVVVGDGFLVLVCNLVGNLAGLDKLLHLCFDGGCALCYLLDELKVARIQLAGLLLRDEDTEL